MTKWAENFCRGFAFSLRGVRLFYTTPGLWKYTVFPLIMVIATYVLLGYLGSCAVGAFAGFIDEKCAQLPDFLQWLATAARAVSILLMIMILSVIAVVSIGTLYELFGGIFFDALIHRFAGNLCNRKLPELNWKFALKAVFDTAIYSVNTMLIILFFLLVNLLLPIAGQIVMILIVSYRFGVVYLAMSGFHFGKNLLQTKAAAYANKMLVLGFGVSIYLMFLFPLAVLFLLPGIMLAGMLIYLELVKK
ncbi:MAG: EI24 domain-containing protein [Lentisphaeria bacterium]|nr:EI24 domain-containing protein [Lentisphaeria bacterium]